GIGCARWNDIDAGQEPDTADGTRGRVTTLCDARNNSRVWAGKNGGERRRNGNKASPCRLLPGAGGRGGCRGHCRGGPNQMAGPVRVGTRQLSYCPRLACGNRRCEVGSASGFSTVPFLGGAGI